MEATVLERLSNLEAENRRLAMKLRAMICTVLLVTASVLLGMQAQDPKSKGSIGSPTMPLALDSLTVTKLTVLESVRVGPEGGGANFSIRCRKEIPQITLSAGGRAGSEARIDADSIRVASGGYAVTVGAAADRKLATRDMPLPGWAYVAIEGPAAPGEKLQIPERDSVARLLLTTGERGPSLELHDLLGKNRVRLGEQTMTFANGQEEQLPLDTLTFWSETGKLMGIYPPR